MDSRFYSLACFWAAFTFLPMPTWADDYARSREALKTLTLSEEPTDTEVKEYLDKVYLVAGRQGVVGSDSPVVAAMAAIPPDSFHLLLDKLEEVGPPHLPKSNHQREIMRHIKGVFHWHAPRFKQQIIAAMPRHILLVITVEEQGWIEDAREELIAMISGNPDMGWPWLVQIVQKVDAPELFEVWLQRLSHGDGHIAAYVFDRYPNRFVELQAAVRQLRQDKPTAMKDKQLIRFGHRDAVDNYLLKLQDIIADIEEHAGAREKVARKEIGNVHKILSEDVLTFFDYDGEPADFFIWYADNYGAIRYDETSRKYVTIMPTVEP